MASICDWHRCKEIHKGPVINYGEGGLQNWQGGGQVLPLQ